MNESISPLLFAPPEGDPYRYSGGERRSRGVSPLEILGWVAYGGLALLLAIVAGVGGENGRLEELIQSFQSR